MLGHVRGLFFVDFPLLASKSFAYRVLYAVTGFGHQAVMIFFVLSGYFIGMSVIDSVSWQRWSWREYLVNRLTRLQLVLFPALILGAIWDQIGMRIPKRPPSTTAAYTSILYRVSLCAPQFRSSSGISSFCRASSRLCLVQTARFGVLATNSGITFCFRRLCSLPLPGREFATVFCMWPRRAPALVYRPADQSYFVIWLAGALVGRLHRTVQSVPPRRQVIISMAAGWLFFGVLAWSRTHQFSSGTLADSLIGFCFALWLYTLIHSSSEDVSPAYAHAAKRLSGFSYTLYLTHFPALLLLRGLIDLRETGSPICCICSMDWESHCSC